MADKKAKPKKAAGLSRLYTVSGEKIARKNKFCPKCGPGTFMAKHSNRVSCGNCGYTEFEGKKSAKEVPKQKLEELKAKETKLHEEITKVTEEIIEE